MVRSYWFDDYSELWIEQRNINGFQRIMLTRRQAMRLADKIKKGCDKREVGT